MSAPPDFTTPAQAVRAMVEAGAVFTVRDSGDVLGISFTYKIEEGGDLEHCRTILASVKSRPPQFFQAFRVAIQDSALGGVSTPPTRSGSEGEAQTPPSASWRIVGGAGAPPTSADAEGGVSTTPTNAGRGAA